MGRDLRLRTGIGSAARVLVPGGDHHSVHRGPDRPYPHGERIRLESTYLPLHRFPDLADTFDPETSLYAVIRSRGIAFTSATERIVTELR